MPNFEFGVEYRQIHADSLVCRANRIVGGWKPRKSQKNNFDPLPKPYEPLTKTERLLCLANEIHAYGHRSPTLCQPYSMANSHTNS
uniref:Uncharacterized protein n=1 Tax=Caenorhabditis japonica TaxID=281687 RepID=A0A8R1IFM9_CAEJA